MLDSILQWLNLEVMGLPFRFHLESLWNLSGIPVELHRYSIQIPLGILLEFHWESMGIHRNHSGIPLGIHGNPQGWYIPTIPDSGEICQNSWRRVKYCFDAVSVCCYCRKTAMTQGLLKLIHIDTHFCFSLFLL